MPYQKFEHVFLASDPTYWVNLRTHYTAGDAEKIAAFKNSGRSMAELDIEVLTDMIMDWNLDEEVLDVEGAPTGEMQKQPIDLEHVRGIYLEDKLQLADLIRDIPMRTEEEKLAFLSSLTSGSRVEVPPQPDLVDSLQTSSLTSTSE